MAYDILQYIYGVRVQVALEIIIMSALTALLYPYDIMRPSLLIKWLLRFSVSFFVDITLLTDTDKMHDCRLISSIRIDFNRLPII